MIACSLPLRLVSEANMHEHWRKRHARSVSHKRIVGFVLNTVARTKPLGDLVVTITRVAPRLLDSDNAVGSAKHVRDGIALWLGRDDGPTSGIEWRVEQQKSAAGVYRVEVRIETAEEARGSRREEVA